MSAVPSHGARISPQYTQLEITFNPESQKSKKVTLLYKSDLPIDRERLMRTMQDELEHIEGHEFQFVRQGRESLAEKRMRELVTSQFPIRILSVTVTMENPQ